MPSIDQNQIKSIITKFIPNEYSDNIFIKSLLAGAAAVGILLATPIWAPVGVVGATGWIVVYIVAGGTFSIEMVKKAWGAWKEMDESQRNKIDDALARLKKTKDDGGLCDSEYQQRVRELLDGKVC